MSHSHLGVNVFLYHCGLPGLAWWAWVSLMGLLGKMLVQVTFSYLANVTFSYVGQLFDAYRQIWGWWAKIIQVTYYKPQFA